MKIEVYARVNLNGCRVTEIVDVPDDELKGLDEESRLAYLEDLAKEVMWDLVEWGWEEIDHVDE